MDEETNKVVVEIAKQTSKDAYNDAVKPVLKPTGETAGLLPRAIKAALLPVEKWVLQREYNLEETKKLLEKKLEKTDLDEIESPEPHIAVPALQYISYCMDSEELRNMYANLLANSMNKIVKNEVHPSFVEIIRQLSPDEARILREFYKKQQIPIIGVRYENEKSEFFDILNIFSNIGEKAKCEYPYNIEKYLDNLERLGLISSNKENHFVDEEIYTKLKEHPEIKKMEKVPISYRKKGYEKMKITEGISRITSFGSLFCKICVNEKE